MARKKKSQGGAERGHRLWSPSPHALRTQKEPENSAGPRSPEICSHTAVSDQGRGMSAQAWGPRVQLWSRAAGQLLGSRLAPSTLNLQVPTCQPGSGVGGGESNGAAPDPSRRHQPHQNPLQVVGTMAGIEEARSGRTEAAQQEGSLVEAGGTEAWSGGQRLLGRGPTGRDSGLWDHCVTQGRFPAKPVPA